MSGCGHDHSGDPVAMTACEANTEIGSFLNELGIYTARAVVIMPMNGEQTAVSMFGNTASMVLAARTILEEVAKMPRPTDCDNCQRAHDRAKLAVEALRPENETIKRMC